MGFAPSKAKEVPMLVLSRKLGESIVIGKDIKVTVLYVDRYKIRLGIEAPRQVAIYREELLPEAKESERAADQQDHPTQERPPTEGTAEESRSA
jgi:carbon storage regulator